MTALPPRVLLVAGPGWGKSHRLEAARPAGGLRLAAADALEADLTAAPWLGVDDLDELDAAEQVRLVRRLAAVPAEAAMVLTSRAPVDPSVRLRLRGTFHERGPADLALDVHDVARLLAEEHDLVDPASAVEVHRRTAGWPALVQLLAHEVARRADGQPRLATGGVAHSWLTAHVLTALPAPSLELLAGLEHCGPLSPPALDTLAAAVAGPGAVEELVRLGVLVRRPLVGRHELVVAVPLAAEAVRDHRPDDDWFRSAATLLEECGEPLAAASAATAVGERAVALQLVAEHGSMLLRRGGAGRLVAVATKEPGDDDLPDQLRLTVADGLRMTGDPVAARTAFRPLAARADQEGWDTALAWRLAMVHYMLGDHELALSVLDQVPSPTGLPLDVAEWHACRAQVLATLGRVEDATADATAALRVAEEEAEPWALASAHLAVARCSHGSRKEAHLERAATAAAAVGDVVAAARAATNRTCLLLAGARYAESVPVAREAVRLTELVSPPGIRVSALHNLGEALAAVGHHDEATWQLRRSLTLSRSLGPGRSATGLLGLGQVHRSRGRIEQARAAYLEAADLARATGERQLVVPALAGLASVFLGIDPEASGRWAREACELASPGQLPEALTARALAATTLGEDAADTARRAVAAAREVQAADRLAEALEVLGTVTPDRHEAVAALTEAVGIWREGGAVPAAAAVEVLLGRLPDTDPVTRSRAREASRSLARIGVHEVHGLPVDGPTARRVVIEVLGGFSVSVGGVVVSQAAWRSRQARTLVKLLAARRGRAVARSVVCGLLWPDDDGEKTGHRLSVLLTTVRGVLDPDKEWPADHYVASDATGLWIDLRHVSVDADDVITDTSHALALLRAGDAVVATEILADVDRRYRGDAFEDEPDEEWADALREEARSAWLRAVHRLLTVGHPGRPADHHRLLMRLLAADPYDEKAHRALVGSFVRSGRHGEARRAFRRWTAAMRSIDAPLPDAAVLTPRRANDPRARPQVAVAASP